jgi:hypothetical protein
MNGTPVRMDDEGSDCIFIISTCFASVSFSVSVISAYYPFFWFPLAPILRIKNQRVQFPPTLLCVGFSCGCYLLLTDRFPYYNTTYFRKNATYGFLNPTSVHEENMKGVRKVILNVSKCKPLGGADLSWTCFF